MIYIQNPFIDDKSILFTFDSGLFAITDDIGFSDERNKQKQTKIIEERFIQHKKTDNNWTQIECENNTRVSKENGQISY